MSGDDKELKSAFDIAMERAQKLGGLSAEDKRKHKEEGLSEVGQALAKRYLSGLPIRDVELELGKYKGDRQTLVRYMLSSLIQKINLTDSIEVDKIIEAIRHFTKRTEVIEGIRSIISEYLAAMERTRLETQNKLLADKKKELSRKGISGSAVEPAIEGSPEWLEVKRDVEASYEERLKRMILPLQTL